MRPKKLNKNVHESLPTFEQFITEKSDTIGGKSVDDVAAIIYDKLPDTLFHWGDPDVDSDKDKLKPGRDTEDAISKALDAEGLPTGKAVISRVRAAINKGL